MWSKKIFKNLGELSHNKTSLSTFSSAELVKLNIGESSFSVNQSKGFGNKKHMLKGLSKISFPKKEKFKRKRIGIIGGGLSGSSLARLLSQRGHEIIVFYKTSQDEVQFAIEPAFILYPTQNFHYILSYIHLSSMKISSQSIGTKLVSS